MENQHVKRKEIDDYLDRLFKLSYELVLNEDTIFGCHPLDLGEFKLIRCAGHKLDEEMIHAKLFNN